MQLLLCFSAFMAVALGVNQNFGSRPTNFQQSQNFHTDQFQTEQFQSQGYQQQEFKLGQPSSNHGGQSNQYLPPSPNNHNNNNHNQLQQGYRNQGQGQGGFQQNQAQSINFQGNQYQGNQAQQAYGNKLQNHQNQHQNQQSNFQNQNSLGQQKNQNRNQNYQSQSQNKQQIYHTETHNAQAIRAHSAQSAHSAHSAVSAHSASSSSKFGAQSFKSSAKKHSSQSSIHDEDIIRNEASPDGSYAYSYDTNDGTSVEQSGYIKNPTARSDEKILSVKGSYSYIAPEGDRISVSYVADENGYRATSSKS